MEGFKISNRNYPVLDMLYKGKLENMPIPESDIDTFFEESLFDIANFFWVLHRDDFMKEINVISKKFLEASIIAGDKLLDLHKKNAEESDSDLHISGTYIIGDSVCMLYYTTIKKENKISLNEVIYFQFTKLGLPACIYIRSPKNDVSIEWVSSVVPSQYAEGFAFGSIASCIVFYMFKRYAQVETKTIFPNSKVKDFHCKYVNDTRLKLTYLDSKWFTNLVKSEGFSVRGHFRLQPKKKNGEWTKELIWINDFEKTGYTAPARMIKNVEQL
jgi:hypothetical protein